MQALHDGDGGLLAREVGAQAAERARRRAEGRLLVLGLFSIAVGVLLLALVMVLLPRLVGLARGAIRRRKEQALVG